MSGGVNLEIGFCVEPADHNVGLGDSFSAWSIAGASWCNLVNYDDSLAACAFEWFDNESGAKVARPAVDGRIVEAALWAVAREFYVRQDDDGAPAHTPNEQTKDGRCCSCGYDGEVETPCLKREDETHCEHWWDGPEEVALVMSPRPEGT